MGQELAQIGQQTSLGLAAEPTKWMPPIVISSLESSDWNWEACALAKRRLAENAVDTRAMLAHADEMVRPVEQHWLADRLKSLWKSTIPSGSLVAKDWLRETGRLIKHLPLDIVAHAIDETIIRSEKGFTPTAGEILAIASPLMRERRRMHTRLRHVVHGMPLQHETHDVPKEERCTPEEAREILEKFGLRSAFEPDSKPRPRNQREPTPEELAQIAREFQGNA